MRWVGCLVGVVAALALLATTTQASVTCHGLANNEHISEAAGRKVFCIDASHSDVTMLVEFNSQHNDAMGTVQVNNDGSICQDCTDCISTLASECHENNKCACNLHCRHGVCSQTVAPLTPGTWYITVDSTHPYDLRVQLIRLVELREGKTRESTLASVRDFTTGGRVQERLAWWDYYAFDALRDGLATVTVHNLKDSGPMRGYVEVMMKQGAYPDQDNNDAVYSTYTRDTVEAHLKDVKKGDRIFVGVLGQGRERWIRYNIRLGGYQFASLYAALAVTGLAILLGGFVWFYKRRLTQMRSRKQLFYSSAY